MLTDEEILNSLYEKEKILSAEVERLEKAKYDLQIIRNTIKAYNPLFVEPNTETAYDVDASWKDKIIFTLKKLGKSGTQDVIDYIQRQEPTNATVKNNVPAVLSRMASNKDIKAKPDSSGKNIYYLETKNEN